MKGKRDQLNAAMALAKSKGEYQIQELLAFEKKCAESFDAKK
jgi:hypothetical protein